MLGAILALEVAIICGLAGVAFMLFKSKKSLQAEISDIKAKARAAFN